jgi:hypothetical protein
MAECRTGVVPQKDVRYEEYKEVGRVGGRGGPLLFQPSSQRSQHPELFQPVQSHIVCTSIPRHSFSIPTLLKVTNKIFTPPIDFWGLCHKQTGAQYPNSTNSPQHACACFYRHLSVLTWQLHPSIQQRCCIAGFAVRQRLSRKVRS